MDIQKEIESLNRILLRLQGTTTDKIEGVLQILLPKIVPMIDNVNLKEIVSQIIAFVLQRVKEWNIRLPVDELITLIKGAGVEAETPLSVNIAISLVNVGIQNLPKSLFVQCIRPIMNGLESFEVFSSQSDLLCNYALEIMESLRNIENEVTSLATRTYPTGIYNAANILGDWFLDLSIAQGSLCRSGVGSIQPGLSSKRSHRLTARRENWNSFDLHQAKMNLIAILDRPWLPAGYCIAISIACSLDKTDDILSTQAAYRVSGARGLFQLGINCNSTWATLLSICRSPLLHNQSCDPFPSSSMLETDTLVQLHRSVHRDEFTIAVLQFITKELIAPANISPSVISQLIGYRNCVQVAQLSTQALSASLLRVLSAIAAMFNQFHDALATNCRNSCSTNRSSGSSNLISDDIQRRTMLISSGSTFNSSDLLVRTEANELLSPAELFIHSSLILLDLASSLLKYLGDSRMSFGAGSTVSPSATSLIHYLCSIVDRSLLISPLIVLDSPILTYSLLRLLALQSSASSCAVNETNSLATLINEKDGKFVSNDSKHQMHFDVVTTLLATLGSIRQLYSQNENSGLKPWIGLEEILKEALLQCLASSEAKCRLLAVQYIRILFGWGSFSLSCILLLTNDHVGFVSEAAVKELDRLRLAFDLGFRAAVTSENVSDENSDSEPSVGDVKPFFNPQMPFEQYDEIVHYLLRAIPPHVEEYARRNVVLRGSGLKGLVLLLRCALAAIGQDLRHKEKSLQIPYLAVSSGFLQEPSIINPKSQGVSDSSYPYDNLHLEDDLFLEIFECFKKIKVDDAGFDCIAYYGSNFMRDILLLKGLQISPSFGKLNFVVESRVGTNFWSPCREILTPLLFSWVSGIYLDGKTLNVVSQVVGLLSLPCQLSRESSGIVDCSNENLLKSETVKADFDYCAKVFRILKLKLKEEMSTQNLRSSSPGAPICILTALVDVLAHFTNWLSLEGGPVTGPFDAWYNLAQVCCNAWMAAINDVLEDSAIDPNPLFQAMAVTSIGVLLHSLHDIPTKYFSEPVSSNIGTEVGESEIRKRKVDVMASDAAENRILEEGGGSQRITAKFILQFDSRKLKIVLLKQIIFTSKGNIESQMQQPSKVESEEGLVYSAIRASSLAAQFGNDSDFHGKVLSKLLENETWHNANSISGRFCVAESICHLVSAIDIRINFPTPLLLLLSQRCMASTQSDKVMIGCILLALSKNGLLFSLISSSILFPFTDDRSVVEVRFSRAATVAVLVAQLLLICLQEQNAFLQDISCFALNHLYLAAAEFDKTIEMERMHSPRSETTIPILSVSERIALEVISALTRDKRKIAPAGVALAGESSGTSVEGEIARMLEGLLEGRPEESTENSNEANTTTDRDRSTGPESERPRNEEIPSRDELLAAASAAAARLGLTPNEIAEAARRAAASNRNPQEVIDRGSYGIYSIACKIAKKASDPAIVFSVIASIQRDAFFSSPLSSGNYSLYVKYLPKPLEIPLSRIKSVVPVLYLTKFDVIPAIRDVMKSLWQSLIVEKQREYLLRTMQKPIIGYLISHMTSKIWRERHSAATALEEIFSHQLATTWKSVQIYLDSIWDAGFYMLDDIKDDCRIAAMHLMKTVAETIIRWCDSSLRATYVEKVAGEVIAFAIPKLLGNGLLASAIEAKGFAIGVITRIVKLSRRLLGEYRAPLLGVLIECMSAFEPRMLQYMQFHTSRLSMSDEELERVRIKVAAESPMQEALDSCLQSLDEECVVDAVRSVTSQITNGVGLATRVAAVKALTAIAETFGERIGLECVPAYRSLILTTLASSRASVTLQHALVGAIGSLSKIIEISELKNTVTDLLNRYKSEENRIDDDDLLLIISACIKQIVTRAGDRLDDRSLWVTILACSFIGLHENPVVNHSADVPESSTATAQGIWMGTWTDALVGSEAGTKSIALQRALPSIALILCHMLNGLSWKRRQHAVRVVKELCDSLSPQQLAPNIGQVLVYLFRAVHSHIWVGQCDILPTIAQVLRTCSHRVINSNQNEDFLLRVSTNHTTVLSLRNFSHLSSKEISEGLSQAHGEAESAVPAKVDQTELFDILGCGGTFRQQLESLSSWTVSGSAVAVLFLAESSRGSADYRLSAAKALTALPWPTILTKRCQDDSVLIAGMQCPESSLSTCIDVGVVSSLTSSICDLFGCTSSCRTILRRFLIESIVQGPVSEEMLPSTVNSTTSNPSPIKQSPQQQTLARTVPTGTNQSFATTAARATAVKKSFEMFGNRYGGSVPKQTTAVPARLSNSAPRSTSTVNAAMLPANPQLATVTPKPERNVQIPRSNSSTSQVDFMLDLHKNLSENIPSTMEPALRMQLIDCLCQILNASNTLGMRVLSSTDVFLSTTISTTNSEQNVELSRWLLELLMWCSSEGIHDVWSIRRASLQLAAAILINFTDGNFPAVSFEASNSPSVNCGKLEVAESSTIADVPKVHIPAETLKATMTEWVLEAILRAVQDRKYSKLRLTALQMFLKLVSVESWARVFSEETRCQRAITAILTFVDSALNAAGASSTGLPSNIAVESDPQIVETLSKIRSAWKK